MKKFKLSRTPTKEEVTEKTVEKWIHPETKKNEVWIGNTSPIIFFNMAWKTKRLGKIPYDPLKCIPFKAHNIFPCFISNQELQDYTRGKETKVEENNTKSKFIKKKTKFIKRR